MIAEKHSLRTMVLTVDPAMPSLSGADLRNNQNAVAATELGQVLLVSVRSHDAAEARDGGRMRLASLSVAGEPRGRTILRRSTDIEVRISQAMLDRLKKLVSEFRPDVVLVEGIPLFQLIEPLRPLAPKVVLDMHNVESDFAEQISRNRPRRRFGWLLRDEADRIATLERRALALVDRVWVCSEEDRERVSRKFEPTVPVDVVPNGIPRQSQIPSQLRPLATADGGFPVLIFVGHMAYAPNVEAAKRLALSILPKVRRTLPSASLIIAGRQADAMVAELGGLDALEVIAGPTDLGPIYQRGHVSVAPLSAGGGTRIKILEAMAWGLPVVATPLAAEGQGFLDGEDIVLADSDQDLAEAIVALCQDPGRMERMRARAHQSALLRFGLKAIHGAVRQGLGLPVPPTRATGTSLPSME